MALVPPVGSLILFTPTRHIFALSSACSTTAHVSRKLRPGVVVKVGPRSDMLAVVPLVGGAYDEKTGLWTGRPDQPHSRFVYDWWKPVEFQGARGVQTPIDGPGYQRTPFPIKHDPSASKPSFYRAFKPSFIWCGDLGETLLQVDIADVVQQQYLFGSYLSVDPAQLKDLENTWEALEESNNAPPDAESPSKSNRWG